MDGYIQVSLSELMEQIGEDRVKSILSNFSCPLNKDVEKFLRSNAILFERQSIARTTLVFTQHKGDNVLVGYFTLAIKNFVVNKGKLSSNLRHRISKFCVDSYDITGTQKESTIVAPLIAQLGKNFTDSYNQLITGDELLKLACEKVAFVQQNIGGKIVYLECEDKPYLIEFYGSNGFVEFGKRQLDRDEKEDLDGQYLIQMLKYMNT